MGVGLSLPITNVVVGLASVVLLKIERYPSAITMVRLKKMKLYYL